MDVIRKRIKLSRLESYAEEKKAFGWVVVAQEDLRPDETVVLIMERDPSQVPDYPAIRSLEKQYFLVRRPYSLSMVICALLGAGFLAAYFVTKSLFIFYIVFLYLALTFFCVAVFALLVFLFVLLKKKKILATIRDEAAMRSGGSKDWPNINNTEPENQGTWALTNMISNK